MLARTSGVGHLIAMESTESVVKPALSGAKYRTDSRLMSDHLLQIMPRCLS